MVITRGAEAEKVPATATGNGGSGNRELSDVVSISNILARQSELPKVQVSIQGKHLLALVDSGAAVTLLSAAAYNQLSRPPALSVSKLHLQSVTGEALPAHGSATFAVKVGGYTPIYPFFLKLD